MLTLFGVVQGAPLDEAKRLEQAGQMAEAISVLEAAVASTPSDIESGRLPCMALWTGGPKQSGDRRVRTTGRAFSQRARST